jgi:hypothetical protein
MLVLPTLKGATVAKRVVTVLTDDLDGTAIEEGNGETVTFGLDGREFEIDLTKSNAKKLRSALDKYISAGRRTGGQKRSRGRAARPSGSPDPQDVRAWAHSHGVTVNERGRIPREIVEQYLAAS